MKTRAALAILLFVAFALLPDASHRDAATMPTSGLHRRPSPRDLQNDCGIVATEAAARLASTGAWTRLIFVLFRYPHDRRVFGHILAVWQPPTARVVCIYDAHGTWDLNTDKHEPAQIGKEWARIARVTLVKAHFIK